MDFRRISSDVKLAAIHLYQRDLLPLDDILDCVGISRSTFFRALRLWEDTGSVTKAPSILRGLTDALQQDDLSYLLRLVKARPNCFLDELLGLLETNRFISVHYATIFLALQSAGVSRKKLDRIAKERNEHLRAHFILEMAKYTPEQLGFLDELSKDDSERTAQRRSRRNRRAAMRGVFLCGRHMSGEGLLTVDGMVASTVVEGSVTREQFLEFLEHEVLPLTSPFPGTLSVLVMGNACIHHGIEVLELLEQYGVRAIYLPPYSPELNPIDEAFLRIKHFIWRFRELMTVPKNALLYNMYIAMDVITPDDALGYIIHAGYF